MSKCFAQSADGSYTVECNVEKSIRITLSVLATGITNSLPKLSPDLRASLKGGAVLENNQALPKKSFSFSNLLRRNSSSLESEISGASELAVSDAGRYVAVLDRSNELWKWSSKTNSWTKCSLLIDAGRLLSNVCISFCKFLLCSTYVVFRQKVDFENIEVDVIQFGEDGSTRCCTVVISKRTNVVLRLSADSTTAFIDDKRIGLHLPNPAVIPHPQSKSESIWMMLSSCFECPLEEALREEIPSQAEEIINHYCLERNRNMALRSLYSSTTSASAFTARVSRKKSPLTDVLSTGMISGFDHAFDALMKIYKSSKGVVSESLCAALSVCFITGSVTNLLHLLRSMSFDASASRQSLEKLSSISRSLSPGEKSCYVSLAHFILSDCSYVLLPSRVHASSGNFVFGKPSSGCVEIANSKEFHRALTFSNALDFLFISGNIRTALRICLNEQNSSELYRLCEFLGPNSALLRDELIRFSSQSVHIGLITPAFVCFLMSDFVGAADLSSRIRVQVFDDLFSRAVEVLKREFGSLQKNICNTSSADFFEDVEQRVSHLDDSLRNVFSPSREGIQSIQNRAPTETMSLEDRLDCIVACSFCLAHLDPSQSTDNGNAPLVRAELLDDLERMLIRYAYLVYLLGLISVGAKLQYAYCDLLCFAEFYQQPHVFQNLILDQNPEETVFFRAGLHRTDALAPHLRAKAEKFVVDRNLSAPSFRDVEPVLFSTQSQNTLAAFSFASSYFTPECVGRIDFSYEKNSMLYMDFLDRLDRSLRFSSDVSSSQLMNALMLNDSRSISPASESSKQSAVLSSPVSIDTAIDAGRIVQCPEPVRPAVLPVPPRSMKSVSTETSAFASNNETVSVVPASLLVQNPPAILKIETGTDPVVFEPEVSLKKSSLLLPSKITERESTPVMLDLAKRQSPRISIVQLMDAEFSGRDTPSRESESVSSVSPRVSGKQPGLANVPHTPSNSGSVSPTRRHSLFRKVAAAADPEREASQPILPHENRPKENKEFKDFSCQAVSRLSSTDASTDPVPEKRHENVLHDAVLAPQQNLAGPQRWAQTSVRPLRIMHEKREAVAPTKNISTSKVRLLRIAQPVVEIQIPERNLGAPLGNQAVTAQQLRILRLPSRLPAPSAPQVSRVISTQTASPRNEAPKCVVPVLMDDLSFLKNISPTPVVEKVSAPVQTDQEIRPPDGSPILVTPTGVPVSDTAPSNLQLTAIKPELLTSSKAATGQFLHVSNLNESQFLEDAGQILQESADFVEMPSITSLLAKVNALDVKVHQAMDKSYSDADFLQVAPVREFPVTPLPQEVAGRAPDMLEDIEKMLSQLQGSSVPSTRIETAEEIIDRRKLHDAMPSRVSYGSHMAQRLSKSRASQVENNTKHRLEKAFQLIKS
eukprot:ANDGO_08072.mRNA.1 hypothetical protein